ncbi:maltose ABC transporter membrane protein /trehalose ABC transporter membrane protein /sucrose ABC transporter membrane protein [Shimia isoporae]|uniref:Maltose ABC transporter membrane protein /trehalose ABC transporter membrane protein /sucrose ABC transporter membrane protein n=1 Tax=Shimia isoporae TaxID=647720 RepID=A0A4R1NL38_9RHOB|nr:carbohydrate ABC transporter permease [Shimia isoporae]TCL08815.1 maltose ABC transporter membrane protein /trehalose ABC transporter membrane protein /sucrose ABC transporter membrane protein [Shimia isoporae]
MDNIAGRKSSLVWTVQLATLALVALWLFPTVGLLVSSFRTADQISSSGWWKSLTASEQVIQLRTGGKDAAREENGLWIVKGNLLTEGDTPPGSDVEITRFGVSSKAVDAFEIGDEAVFSKDSKTFTLLKDGSYRLTSTKELKSRGQRVFVTAVLPPEFTLKNYEQVLLSGDTTDSMAKAFFNTLTVTIPATIIPIVIAAFAAYALAWMEFPGRSLLIAAVVALLVVPLQLALIPLLKLHLGIGIGKGYLGVWLAHTGFGLPLAIYLLRNYMAGLPRDIIENAKVDGATDFQVFTKIVLPLSFPALASFAIFQFLWTWNDLLVAKVFLIDATGETTVMTNQIVELLGTRGGNWEILATAAFVSIAVPLAVFFAMQRYLVRGLLAGSVK